jgi:biopolymer transport protein ExbD
VILISDKGARTGTLVDVMDQVQAAGVRRMAVSAEQIGGGG